MGIWTVAFEREASATTSAMRSSGAGSSILERCENSGSAVWSRSMSRVTELPATGSPSISHPSHCTVMGGSAQSSTRSLSMQRCVPGKWLIQSSAVGSTDRVSSR